MTFRINFNTNPPTADRVAPPEGLTKDATMLANLTQYDGLMPEAVGFAWYSDERYEETPHDKTTHTADAEQILEINTVEKFVRFTRAVRPLTPEEIADRAAALKTVKDDLVKKVDDLIAGIYAKWMRFEAEYKEREAAARAFVQAGYTGDPSDWVTSFASSADKTNEQAANLIIAQADGLRSALKQLGALRMTKYAILSAPDAGAAQVKHDEIIAQANAIAASLQ